MSYEDIENRFTYHAPDEEQQVKYALLRGDAKALAQTARVPPGAALASGPGPSS